MFFEPVTIVQMNSSGRSLLQSLQDITTPVPDHIVREAIQNSTDAVKCGVEKVIVDFSLGSFKSKDLSVHLDSIQDKLDEYYSDEEYNYLCIRDYNTSGLGGKIDRSSEIGSEDSFTKLVYVVGFNQQQQGAGGSWGLGKTVYYRVGNGIVFYYSRFKDENNQYQERLAACLIEDHEKTQALSKGKSICGVAWWGAQGDNGLSVPITNPDEISNILRIFNIEQYKGTETGTAVIIPYVIPGTLCPTNAEAQECWWCHDLMEYLKISVQKWYAPRILNKSFSRPYLEPHFNGIPFQDDEMMPFFRTIRELYQEANDAKEDDEQSILKSSDITKQTISTRNTFENGGSAGCFAVAKIRGDQLQMTPPDNNPSPYALIRNSYKADEEEKHQIVVYTRGPGMILEYPKADDHSWTCPDAISCECDEYIVGVFSANTSQIMKEGKKNFGDYLRNLELANHSSWPQVPVVKNIQTTVKRFLKDLFQKKDVEDRHDAPQELRNFLADKLLPMSSFGEEPSHKRSKTPPSTGTKAGTSFTVSEPELSESGSDVILTFKFKIASKESLETIYLAIATGNNKLNNSSWKEKTGLEFPLIPIAAELKNCSCAKEKILKKDPRFPQITTDGEECSIVIKTDFSESKWQAEGSIQMKSSDAKIGVVFDLKGGKKK